VTLDRSAPGVRITLLESERSSGGEPLDLRDRVLSFSYEDSEKKADQVSIQLDNFDLSLFERPELTGGAVLEVSWGYPRNMAPPRRVVVKKLKGFQQLTLEGQATSVLLNREAKTRSWQNKTRAEVAHEIAEEQGYEEGFIHIEDTTVRFDVINQSAETDARFLKRLAAREEFSFFVDDQGFHFRPRDQASPPTHVLTWYADRGRGDVLSVGMESDLGRRAGSVAVRGRNPLSKGTITTEATKDSVPRASLAEVVEVVDPKTGETSLQARNATASVHPTSAANPASAEREAQARFRRAERETIKLSLQVVGNPTLRAKSVIEVRGISKLLSGKYYVTEAKHTISSSGYVIDLKLTRDGSGGRPAGRAATGQPQGGEPNRQQPSTGAELRAVEVIDRETGAARVEYRQSGRVIGAEDPEARVSIAQVNR
jgi:uncharacterized protein